MPAFGYTTEGGFEVSPFIDMINGGGPGRSGDVFEGGGILSALANAVATPYGSQRQRRGMPQFPGAPDPMDPLYGAVTGAFDEITPRSDESFPMTGGEEPGAGLSPATTTDASEPRDLFERDYAVTVTETDFGLPGYRLPFDVLPGDMLVGAEALALQRARNAVQNYAGSGMTPSTAYVPSTVPSASEPRDLFERDYAGMPVSGVTVTEADFDLQDNPLPFDVLPGDMLIGAEALNLQRARNEALGSAQPNISRGVPGTVPSTAPRNYAGSGMTPATAYVPAAQIMFEGTDGAYAGMTHGAGRQPGMPLEIYPSELSQAEYDQIMAEMRVAYPSLPEPELEALARNFGFLP